MKYTKEALLAAAAESVSVAGVIRKLGLKPAGGSQSYISRRLKHFKIDTSHFTGQAHMRGKVSSQRKTPAEIFVVLPEGSLRAKAALLYRALIESGVAEECTKCGNGITWNGKPLKLEVDHRDGNWLNNLRENLRFLCPNCHSQEDTTNLPHKYRTGERAVSKCDCGNVKQWRSKQCLACYHKVRHAAKVSRIRPVQQVKISWPDSSALELMVQELGYSATGRRLGVSDNAVRKRLRTRPTV